MLTMCLGFPDKSVRWPITGKNLPFWHHADVIVEAEMGSSATYEIQIAGGFAVWDSDKALKQKFLCFHSQKCSHCT